MARLVAGLYALDGHNAAVPLRLESVDLRGTILGSYATVVLKVAFSLPREPVERGAYFFPLSTDSAVLGLRATIEAPGLPTRILRGAVLEKETARRGFRAAVVAGRSAAVLEREAASEDVFRLDLGCLPAGGTVEVEVQFTQALRVFRSSPSAARLVIPAALVHRYVPVAGAGIGGARFAYALASAAEALASRGDAVDHPSLCLSLVVQSIRSIQTVSSPSHAAYASTRLLATAHAASGPGGSEDAVLLSISVPKSQWLTPAAYADLIVIVEFDGMDAPGAFLWVEPAVLVSAESKRDCASVTSGSAGCSIDSLAAAVLAVSRAFADDAIAAAVRATEGVAALPAGWRLAMSDDEADDLALADRSVRSYPSGGGEAMDVDVEVVMPWEDPKAAGLRASAASAAAAPSLPPDTPGYVGMALRAPHEFVFVIDCSGSMAGSRIAAARSALQLALRSMPAGSRFQVLRFGTLVSAVFPEALFVPADDTHIARATSAVARISADLGGTELEQPLRIALTPAPLGAALLYARRRGDDDGAAIKDKHVTVGAPRLLGDSSRTVLLLTDGEVGNTRAIIDAARADAAKTGARVHCFGIGSCVSTALVQGIADSTGGVCEMLADGEDYKAKVVRVMAAAQSVDISVSVDWALPPAANALSVLPTSTTVKHGDVARLFAAWLPDALERTCWRPEHAHIVVRRGDGLSVRIPVAAAAPPAATDASSSRSDAAVPFSLSMGRNVAALAVQSALKALEAAEDRELTDAAKQGIVAPEVLRSAVFDSLVGTSTRFGVLCRHTALFAEDLTPRCADGDHRPRLPPARVSAVRASEMWAGASISDVLESDVYAAAAARATAEASLMLPPPPLPEHDFDDCEGSEGDSEGELEGAGGLFGDDDDDWAPAPPPVSLVPPPPMLTPVSTCMPPSVPKAPVCGSPPAASVAVSVELASRFDSLVVLQAADGAFNLDARLAIILGCDLRDLHGAMSCAATPLCDLGYVVSERAWATALVLVALDSTFAPLRESWSLFASRSTLWLSRTLRTCQARECPIGAPSATGSVPEAHQVVTSAGAGAARIMAALMLSARKTLGT